MFQKLGAARFENTKLQAECDQQKRTIAELKATQRSLENRSNRVQVNDVREDCF